MSQKLASDLDNPDFAGAVNPDSRLAVMFYKKAMQNEYESEQQKRPVFYEVDFVRIQVPGDTTTVIDTPVRDEHKKRFPLHWAHYQNSQGSDTAEVGTPLEQWPRINKAQALELRALGFKTVENVAGATDQNIQRTGMIYAGGAFKLREDAQRFLRVAHDDAETSAAEEKAKALAEENAKLRAELEAQKADTQKQLDDLKAMIAAAAPKKRGPKPKQAEA